MTENKWKSVIMDQLEALKLSDQAYDPIVKTLASILARRDKVEREFKQKGGEAAIEYTNKGGSTNLTKNPLLTLWDDLNKSALAYWRELGLTPSAYRKITGDSAPKKQERSGLAAALRAIETE